MNFNNYKNKNFSCPKCNWNGLGSVPFLGDLSETHTFRDIECPKCEAKIYTFDLSKVELPLGNPLKDEKVCFNCANMLWMVGIGQGVKCSFTMQNIPNRYHTCDKFEVK